MPCHRFLTKQVMTVLNLPFFGFMQKFTIPGNDALMSIITEFYQIMVIIFNSYTDVNFDKTPTLFSTHIRKERCLF